MKRAARTAGRPSCLTFQALAKRSIFLSYGARVLLIVMLAMLGSALFYGSCESRAFTETQLRIPENGHAVNSQRPSRYSTPECKPHPTECSGICETVGKYVANTRNRALSDPTSWLWYYQGVADYYRCANAKKVVEVGAAFGAQANFHLKHLSDLLAEYHIVDPFMAGYDLHDETSAVFQRAAPHATPEDISIAWAQSMAKDLSGGMYMDEGMTPPGCKLRVHRLKSIEGAELFGDHSVDAVFIDGLHTYEGVDADIAAWLSKIRVGGSLIFNDYNAIRLFPGVSKAVKEAAQRQNLEILMLDKTNALLGGRRECAKGPPPPV